MVSYALLVVEDFDEDPPGPEAATRHDSVDELLDAIRQQLEWGTPWKAIVVVDASDLPKVFE